MSACLRIPARARRVCLCLAGVTLLGVAPEAAALSGVCPDGSVFVVQSRASVPCANAHIVEDPSQLPPMRPEYLPHPYTWEVDREVRNPNNPYNLMETAEKIRRARAQQAEAAQESGGQEPVKREPLAEPQAPAPGSVPVLGLSRDELRDLVRLVSLRQEQAPAEIRVEDLSGHQQLDILLAHSKSFEDLVLGAMGEQPGSKRVIAFTASAPDETDFQPNFFVTQAGKTFRPDPRDAREVGYLVGEAGPIPAGALALGYVVIPGHFDVTEPLAIWWNDRSVDAVLAP